jgi:hypothetical protein
MGVLAKVKDGDEIPVALDMFSSVQLLTGFAHSVLSLSL